MAVWKMHQRWPDMAFLAEVYPKLAQWHDWWPTARDGNKNGLLEWGSNGGGFQGAQGRGVQTIRTALVEALNRRGIDGEARVPWYFPTPAEYAARLEKGGFRVDSMTLFPRPTPLPGDVIAWLETFGENFIHALAPGERAQYVEEVRSDLEPKLRDADGTWIADYVRLRFAATKRD